MDTNRNSSDQNPAPQVSGSRERKTSNDEFLAPFLGPFDPNDVLRRVIDHMLGLVGVLDPQGVVLDVNQTALDIGGLTRDQVIGIPFWETRWWNHDANIVAQLRSAVSQAAAGKTIRYDVTVRTAGEQRMALDFCLTPVRDQNGTVRLLIPSGVDITDRELAIERYKNSEERLRLAAEATGLGTYDYDPGSKHLYWSPEVKRIFGLEESVRPTPELVANLVYPADRPAYQEFIESTLAVGSPGNHELTFRCMRTDGEIRWVRDVGKTFYSGDGRQRRPVRIVGTLQDVTERKRAEASIEESELRFRTLADNMSQFAWIADRNGEITWYNKRWFEYTGSDLDSMRGWGWTAVHHPDHLQRVVEKIRHSFETGDEWEDTFPLRSKDGEYRWFLSRAIPIRNSVGQIVQWFGTNTDVTELREIEQELRLAQRHAEQASEAKSNFLANMSHEIRSPMTAIIGYLDLLSVSTDEDRERIEIIKRNSNYLLTLINDILDLSKIESGHMSLDPTPCSPASLTKEVVHLMRVPAEEKSIELTVEFRTSIPETIEIDAVRLRQILINLVGNAIKFTERGSVRVVVSYEKRFRHLNWEVIDTGIGIHPEQQQRVFQAFEQADASTVRKYGGSGLGLAISAQLAKLFGGSIAIASVPGEGSSFRLILPIKGEVRFQSRADAGRDAAPESKAKPEVTSSLSGVRVLVVDDLPDIRFLIQHLIEKSGGTVECRDNGADAIEAIDPADPAFDVLVMDMQMPVMDGVTAIRCLREAGCEIPAIALTANAMRSDRERCLQAGYDEYLSKPIDAARLDHLIRKALKRPRSKKN